jgi:hypothetical protein
MSTTHLKMISAGIFFLVISLLGFLLSRSGKPYNLVVFTTHKLISIGAVVYLTITILQVHQASPLNTLQWFMVGITALCFLATILTGGLWSVERTMPAILLKLHQIGPYLTLLSTAAMFYFIW